MQNIREKLKRKLSMHDKNPNFDETQDPEELDDETHGHLSREIEKAEQEGHPQGKPGSFLNRMISHGNKKTEDQLAADQRKAQGTEIGTGGAGGMTEGQRGLSSENK